MVLFKIKKKLKKKKLLRTRTEIWLLRMSVNIFTNMDDDVRIIKRPFNKWNLRNL